MIGAGSKLSRGGLSLCLAAILGATACGCGSDDDGDRAGPREVAERVARALAAGDSDACRYLNATAVDEFTELTGTATCADAVRAPVEPIKPLRAPEPHQLRAHLDEAELSGRRDNRHFTIPIPPRGQEKLDLVRSGDGWQVSTVIWSRTEICRRGENC